MQKARGDEKANVGSLREGLGKNKSEGGPGNESDSNLKMLPSYDRSRGGSEGVDAGARGHANVGAHNKNGAIATEGFESGGMKQGESPSAVAMRIAKKVVERQQEQEDKFGPSKREVVERQREEEDKLNPSKRDLGTSMTLKARVRRKEDVGEWVRVAVDKVLVPKIERVPELSLGTVPPVLSGI